MTAIAAAAVLLAGVCVLQAAQNENEVADRVRVEGKRVWIEGVGGYKVSEPMYEAVAAVARYLGTGRSPQYLQGIAGSPFRIAGICPCAPTSEMLMGTGEFAETLGYTVTSINMRNTVDDYGELKDLADAFMKNGNALPKPDSLADSRLQEQARQVREIIGQIKASIRRGIPAIVWHAFTNAEFDVVTGYDDSTGEFLGWGSYNNPEDGSYARAPQGRMVTTAYVGGLPEAILLSATAEEPDARSAELQALTRAIKHAHSKKNVDRLGSEEWVFLHGTACYSRWADDWKKPEKRRGAGDSYCFGVYSATHKLAAGFLREIAPKHKRAEKELLHAADFFEAESEVLEKARDILWWTAPQEPDPERNTQAAAILGQARDSYVNGIAALERAVKQMN